MKIFIPIKERSQRVPNKNFRIFQGNPLYKYTLKKLNKFKVYVDTDSETMYNGILADSSLKHVTPYMRKPELMGDDVSVCILIVDFLARFSIEHETICQLHVTSPFLKTGTLLSAADKMQVYDSVISCNALQTMLWRKEWYGMCPVNHNPVALQQTQDLPILYEENSLFYIFNSDIILKTGNRIGNNPYFYETKFPENIDIDWESDWDLANMVKK